MKFILAVLTKLAQSKTNPALLQIFHMIYEYPSPLNRFDAQNISLAWTNKEDSSDV